MSSYRQWKARTHETVTPSLSAIASSTANVPRPIASIGEVAHGLPQLLRGIIAIMVVLMWPRARAASPSSSDAHAGSNVPLHHE